MNKEVREELRLPLPLQLQQSLREALQCCALQLGQSVVSFMQDGNQEALEVACAQLARIGGLTRLLGARRAAMFCLELDGLLRYCNSGREQWAHARSPANMLTSTQANMNKILGGEREANAQDLLGGAVVQLQHFLVGLSESVSVPVADDVFDVARSNQLRRARGKAALTPDVGNPKAQSSCGRFPVPDFVPLILQRIATLQAGLRSADEVDIDAEALRAQGQQLTELASLLEVCGLSLEMRRLPVALVHLEWHFRYLSAHSQPLTPERIANTARLSPGDYLLLDGRRNLLAILSARLDRLLVSLSEIMHTNATTNAVRRITCAAQEFLRIIEAIRLLALGGVMPVLPSSHLSLMQHGAALCRHINCNVNRSFFDTGSASASSLLVRVVLMLQNRLQNFLQKCSQKHLQKLTLMHEGQDRHTEALAGKICRDCARFVTRRQNDLRDSMLRIHRVDSEFLECARSEIALCRESLHSSLDDMAGLQGIHYVSETLCTTVSRLSQTVLVTGQVAFHEILEELRECLTLGLEQQYRIDSVLTAALDALCDLLQKPLPTTLEEVWCSDLQRQQLSECIHRCAQQMHLLHNAEDSAESVTCGSDDGQQSRAYVDVEQLPVHLARNIHDLLFCAEELALCAGSPERFEALNRRLIVELRMLALGARALHVHRVSRLSAVLAEVHQAVASNPQELPLPLLVHAHRQLRSGLNQAAARQEVSSNREVIAELYQWLEDQFHQAASRDAAEGYAIFHREAEELVSCIEEGARKPAERRDTGKLLHHLHTLKGNARLFGANAVALLCHRCEQTLLSVTQNRHLMSAIAESGSGVIYMAGEEHADDVSCSELAPLVQELRTAIDDLKPDATRQDNNPADKAFHQRPSRIPLAGAHERGVVITAQSLQRMATLASAARTGSRAMSDVLQSCRQGAEPSRLSLLGDLLIEQERCTVQLDEEIAGSTRISFARLTPRLQRLVGRHANLLDRQVIFHVRNDELYADRALVESLVAPLEHLLRNAIDHGIEPVAERRARGKPDSGTLTLVLEEKDNLLIIDLTDDGAGIDVDALPAHASRLGITVDPQVAVSERLQWLFLPGFSSRESPTEDAGHGIGLAMVGSTVAELGGHVEVVSAPGQGSCFRIALPR